MDFGATIVYVTGVHTKTQPAARQLKDVLRTYMYMYIVYVHDCAV